MRDTAFIWWRRERNVGWKSDLHVHVFRGILLFIKTVYTCKCITFMCMSSLRDKIHAFVAKFSKRCFCCFPVRPVGAHPGEHQQGVSIQIPINLGKTFLGISHIGNIPLTQILDRVFVYLPPFISQILDLNHGMVLIFILIYFKWCDTENQ